jgi:iron complex transport system substrate-binding protein
MTRRVLLTGLLVVYPLAAVGCVEHDEPVAITGARRVVSLVPSVTDLILTLGAQDRLIGRTRYDTDPRVAALTSVGGTIDASVEAIVALRPDLVLVWDDSASPRLGAQLRRAGIRAHTVGTSTLADLRETIRSVGHLLSIERGADSILQAIDESLAVIRASTSGPARPRVFYMVSRRPLITAGGKTFLDDIIEVAGGRNVFHDQLHPWPEVSMEEVLRRDPEVILVPTYAGNERGAEDLRARAQWATVSAIRSGRVYAIGADLFNRPGPRTPAAARTLATLLHPGSDSVPR